MTSPMNGETQGMSRRLGVVAAHSKPEAQELIREISSWLSERGITVVPEESIGAGPDGDVEAIIVLGGDGLMMRMGNTFPDVPLIGINFGKVGFLALVEQSDWHRALEMYL